MFQEILHPKENQNHIKSTIFLSVFITGILLQVSFQTLTYTILFSLIAFLAILFTQINHKTFVLSLICVFILASIYANYRLPLIKYDNISNFADFKSKKIIGTVITEPEPRPNNKLRFVLAAEKIIYKSGYLPVTGNVMVNIKQANKLKADFKIGYKISVSGKVYKLEKATNPYEFDYGNYLYYRDIHSLMSSRYTNIEVLSQPKKVHLKLLAYLNQIKDHIQSVHETGLNSAQAQLLGGVVLGERAVNMDEPLKETFIQSGLVHILAASGINVALLALAWVFVTSKLGFNRHVQIIGGMIIIVVYALMTGLPPSVLRSAIMFEIIFIGKLIDAKAKMIPILLFAAVLLLIINPFYIKDIGFQLSFLTTFGLIVTVPVLSRYVITIPQGIAMLVIVPIVAQLWAMPILLYNFHNVALYSIFANFIVMPILAIITYAGFVSSLLSLIPGIGVFLATLINKAVSPVLSTILWVAEYFSSLPHSIKHFSINHSLGIFLFYGILGLFIYLLHKNAKVKYYITVLCILFLVFAGLYLFNPNHDKLKLTLFSVKNSTAMLIRTPNGKNILINTGSGSRSGYTAFNWSIKPYIHAHSINKLDAIILTSDDSNYTGGLTAISNAIPFTHLIDATFAEDEMNVESSQPYTKISPYATVKLDSNLTLKAIPFSNNAFPGVQALHLFSYNEHQILFLPNTLPSSIELTEKIKNPAIIIFPADPTPKTSYIELMKKINPSYILIPSDKKNANIYIKAFKKRDFILDKIHTTGKDGAIEVMIGKKSININSYLD